MSATAPAIAPIVTDTSDDPGSDEDPCAPAPHSEAERHSSVYELTANDPDANGLSRDRTVFSLSQRTIEQFRSMLQVGRSFRAGSNRVLVIAPSGKLACEAVIQETFPRAVEFDGRALLKAVRETGSHDLTVDEQCIHVGMASRTTEVECSPTTMRRARDLSCELLFSFPLSTDEVHSLTKAMRIMGQLWTITNDAERIRVAVSNHDTWQAANSFELEVHGDPAGIVARIVLDRPPKLIPQDYVVNVSRTAVEFRSNDLTYWQVPADDSRFNEPATEDELAQSGVADFAAEPGCIA
jgi:hypothetical protein